MPYHHLPPVDGHILLTIAAQTLFAGTGDKAFTDHLDSNHKEDERRPPMVVVLYPGGKTDPRA
jgi:hypothetical protein